MHVGRAPNCGKPAAHYPNGVDAKGVRWVCCFHDAETDECKAWMHETNTKGCGALTKMGLALCETYAVNPKFYSATYCVGCKQHLPVGEFRWDEDGAVVGS